MSPSLVMLYGAAMPEDAPGADESPAEPIPLDLGIPVEGLVRVRAAALKIDAEPVLAIIRELIRARLLLAPVTTLAPDAQARADLNRYRDLPPPPDVPGQGVRPETPDELAADTDLLDDEELPAVMGTSTDVMAGWASAEIPMAPPEPEPEGTDDAAS